MKLLQFMNFTLFQKVSGLLFLDSLPAAVGLTGPIVCRTFFCLTVDNSSEPCVPKHLCIKQAQ